MRVHCDDWVLDTATRQIVRRGEDVHVSPKAFDLLTTLLVERPRAVSKTELLSRLWPDTFVSDVNLAGLVAEVRSALGDPARRPRYVRTVHSHGYAFCGAATDDDPRPVTSGQVASGARLVMGGREIELAPGENVLGRTPEARVRIDSVSVSRRHARITVSEAGAMIEDLNSKNGTFVNRTRISGVQPLADGDEIRLGPERLVFRGTDEPSSTKSEVQ